MPQVQIPYTINQSTPLPSSNDFIATATPIKESGVKASVSQAQSVNTDMQHSIRMANSSLIRINGCNGEVEWSLQLQFKGYFGLWDYDENQNIIVAAYTTTPDGQAATCLSKITPSGEELIRVNIGSGRVESMTFNKGKWYVFGNFGENISIFRLNTDLDIELVKRVDRNNNSLLFSTKTSPMYFASNKILYNLDENMETISSKQYEIPIIDGRIGVVTTGAKSSQPFVYILLENNAIERLKYMDGRWVQETMAPLDERVLDMCVNAAYASDKLYLLTKNKLYSVGPDMKIQKSVPVKNAVFPGIEVTPDNKLFLFNQETDNFYLEDDDIFDKDSFEFSIPDARTVFQSSLPQKSWSNDTVPVAANAPYRPSKDTSSEEEPEDLISEPMNTTKPSVRSSCMAASATKADVKKVAPTTRNTTVAPTTKCTDCHKNANLTFPIVTAVILLFCCAYLQFGTKVNPLIVWPLFVVIVAVLLIFWL
jgi:hypothetical protein